MTPPAEPAADRATTDAAGSDPIVDAIAGWRGEASEFGGRNPLLWYRDLPRGTFDLTIAHPGGVAKLLAGKPTLLSDLVRERVAFSDASGRIRTIRDTANRMHRDHGMSTAFISIGMASWTIRRAPTPPRAPVLLRPCRITATSAAYTDFTISADPYLMVNPVLAHYLTAELGRRVDVDRLVDLATHAHGFDPRPAYDELEAICSGLEGFGIGPQMVISTFPWAKLPFVAALSGSEPERRLAQAPLVQLLATAPETSTATGTVAAEESADSSDASDGNVAASDADDLPVGATVLSADRSQRAVIAATRGGESFVVDAPGGSGRTQTIANIVADRIGAGQRVLVLSEFTPALRELTERIDDAGLGDRAFWITDHPADLGGLADGLRSNLTGDEKREPPSTSEASERITTATALVSTHQAAMHTPHEPWGATLIQAQETLARLAARSRPPISHVRLTGTPLRDLLPTDLDDLCSQLGTAAATGAWQRGRGDDPWYGAELADETETTRAGDIVSRLVGGDLDRARERTADVCRAAGLPAPATIDQWRQYLDLLAAAHTTLDIFRSGIYDAPLDELAAAYDPSPSRRPSAMARSRAKRQAKGLLRPGMPPANLGEKVRAARDEWRTWEELAGRAARPSAVAGWQEAAEEFDPIEADLDWLATVLEGTSIVEELRTLHLDTLLERLLRLDARPDRLAHAAKSYALLQPLREAGLGPLVDDLAARGVQEDQVGAEVEFVYWTSLLDEFTQARPPGEGIAIRSAIAGIDTAERELTDARRYEVRAAVASEVPQALRRFAPQATYLRESDPGHDVAGWVGSIAGLAQVLRPCWMISPVLVPALIPNRVTFDLVIIDDATRIPVSHAITALSRATQVVAFGSALDGETPRRGDAAEGSVGREATGGSVWHALADRTRSLPLRGDYRTIDERIRLPLRRAGIDAGEGYPGLLRSPRYSAVWSDPDDLIDSTVERILDHARGAAWQSLAVLSPDPALVARLDHRLRERIDADGLGRTFRDDAPEALLLSTVQDAAGQVRDRVFLVMENHRELSGATFTSAVIGARRSIVALIGGGAGRALPGGPGGELLADALQLGETADGEASTPPGGGHSMHGSQLLDDLGARLQAEMLTVGGPIGQGSRRIDLTINDPEFPDRPLVAVRSDLHPWNGRGEASRASEDGLGGSDIADVHDNDARVIDRDQLHLVPRHLARLGWATEEVWCNDLFRDPAREVARLVQAARDASRLRGDGARS